MKKALTFILIYLFLLIAGILLSTFIYSLYLNVTGFTAGKPLNLFNTPDIIKSFFYVSACFCFLICPLLSYYRIRHSYGFLQTCAYILIFFITWLIVFPVTVKLKNFVKNNFNIEQQNVALTGGYFRKVGDKIYYLAEDYNFDKTTRIIEINTDEDVPAKYGVVFSEDDFELLTAGKNYRDVIIKSTFEDSTMPKFVNLRSLVEYGENSLEGGVIPYLCFLSLALALVTVYGITAFFDWKFLSVCAVALITLGILSFNTLYFSSYFASLKNHIYNISLFNFLNGFIDNSFLVVVNLLVSSIFIVTGIIVFFLHKNSAKKEEE
jgi:hypothetical protein